MEMQLSGEDANAAGSLNFLFGLFAEESGFDDDWLVWHLTFGQDFVDLVGGAIDNWGFGFAGVLLSDVFADQTPQVVNVDGWAEVLVLLQVKVSHTDLTEVTWMVLARDTSVRPLLLQAPDEHEVVVCGGRGSPLLLPSAGGRRHQPGTEILRGPRQV